MRWTRIVALVIVGAALAFVVWPFSISSYEPPARPPAASGLETPTVEDVTGVVARSRCGPAIIDAWHEKQQFGGWLAYTPLSRERLVGPEPACRGAAQHRLRLANLALLGVLAVALAASFAERRGPGFGPAPSPLI
jgi:hypothetical protein